MYLKKRLQKKDELRVQLLRARSFFLDKNAGYVRTGHMVCWTLCGDKTVLLPHAFNLV